MTAVGLVQSAIVVALSFVCFYPCLSGEFVFDDIPAIVQNKDVSPIPQPREIWDIFQHDFWGDSLVSNSSHKSFRPVTTLLFRALAHTNSNSASFSPFPFHLANLILHGCNSLLVLLFLNRHLPTTFSNSSLLLHFPFLCALLFACHPVHTESVASAVGLADLLYAFITLFSMERFFQFRSLFSELLAISLLSSLAVLCKEQGIMLTSLVLARDAIFVHKLSVTKWLLPKCRHSPTLLVKTAFYFTLVSATLYLRLWAMDFKGPRFQSADNPTAFHSSLWVRVVNRTYQYALHSFLMFLPDWLCFDWAMGCVRLIDSWTDPRLALILLFCFLLLRILIKCIETTGLDPPITLALAFLILPFLPASNVFFNVGFVIAERNLYLSVLGQVILVGTAIIRLVNLKILSPNFTKAMILIIIFNYTCRSHLRALDWRTEHDLFRSGLRVCPNNAKVHYNIAKKASDEGDDKTAVGEYKVAIGLHPEYEHALNNLGNIYRRQKRHGEALEVLKRAVAVSPKFAAAWMNLGTVQAALKDFRNSEDSYFKALSFRERYPDCWYNLGNLYLKTRESEKARNAFEQATFLNPEHKSSWLNLIILSDEQDLLKEAETYAHRALRHLPFEPDLYFHLGNVYGKREKFEISEENYLKAINLRGTSSAYYGNLGVLYHRWKRIPQARQAYERALALDRNNFSARRNLESLN